MNPNFCTFRKFTVFLIFFIQINFLQFLFAQEVKIDSLTVGAGLSQGFVGSILEDSRGFFWFATRSGLNRFDGQNFKVYRFHPNDSTSLIENQIKSLVEDDFGRIWISTHKKGLECFNPTTGIFHHFGFNFTDLDDSEYYLPFLFKNANGRIWIHRAHNAIEIVGHDSPNLDSIQFVHPNFSSEFKPSEIFTYLSFQMSGEKFRFSNSKIEYAESENNLFVDLEISTSSSDRNFAFQSIDNSGTQWVYFNDTLKCIDGGKIVKEYKLDIELSAGMKIHQRNYIHEDNFGNLWMLIDSRLFKIDKDELKKSQMHAEPVISTSICLHMYKDQIGKLWIGTNGYGVRIIDPNKPIIENQFPHNSCNRINFIKDSIYQIGFDIVKLNGEILARYTEKELIGDGIFIYTRDAESLELKVEKKNKVSKIADLSAQKTKVKIDQDKNYWHFNIRDSFFVKWYNEDTVNYFTYDSLWLNDQERIINSIYSGFDGVKYLSTDKGLVSTKVDRKNNNASFKYWGMRQNNGLNNENVLCSVDDPFEPEKYIWVGTNGSGFYKLNKITGQIVNFTTKNGLPNNVVYSIIPDDYGHLWMSTNFGLSQFNLETHHFRNLTAKEDGLQADEFNTNAYHKLSDGRMIFGGVKGISIIDPKDFLPQEEFGKVTFTDLKINNVNVEYDSENAILDKPLHITEQINLDYNQNFITVGFAALKGYNLGKTTYKYKMEGVDKDWIFANEKTELSYPNLEPGKYNLKVADINQAGNLNPNYASLKFHISSPWWASNLAYVIYAVLFFSLLYILFNNRLRQAKMRQELLYNEREMVQLKELDNLKSRFFSNITHEFRTPLTLIIEPARKNLQSSNPQLKKQSSLIFNNANRLLLLVNQLLDMSKVEEKKMQVNKNFGDIMPVIKEIFNYFKPLADKKQLELIWESTEIELLVNTDKHLIEKILFNLLSNAIKFTPDKGFVKLKISLLKEQIDYWQISVEDTGIGIDKSQLPKVYDRFYQADNSSTREAEGSGIGLSLVKEFANILNGSIEVKSKKDVGSIFTVRFPLIHGSTEGKVIPINRNHTSELLKDILNPAEYESTSLGLTKQTNDNAKAVVLIVEDNRDMHQYISEILNQNNYECLIAENGKSGLSLAKEISPDIIIADVMMPIMDGFQMLDLLKEDILTSHIPVMMLTAKIRTQSKIEGYRKGAQAYLLKPFNSEELLVRLDQILIAREKLQNYIINWQKKPKDFVKPSDLQELEKDQLQFELSDLDLKWVEKLNSIIKVKLLEGSCTIVSLASDMFMSRTKFFGKVKALAGTTPAAYIREIRLDLAYELVLENPNQSFSSISNSLGMSDSKHFKKLFINKFGVDPKQISNN